jgi:hypothetical protein
MENDSPEVNKILGIFLDEMIKSSGKFTPYELSSCLYGLKSMPIHNDKSIVAKILSFLVKEISLSQDSFSPS